MRANLESSLDGILSNVGEMYTMTTTSTRSTPITLYNIQNIIKTSKTSLSSKRRDSPRATQPNIRKPPTKQILTSQVPKIQSHKHTN